MDFSNNTSSNFNLFNTFNNFNNANDFQGTSTLQQPSDMQDQSSIQPGIFAVDQFLFAPQSENTVDHASAAQSINHFEAPNGVMDFEVSNHLQNLNCIPSTLLAPAGTALGPQQVDDLPDTDFNLYNDPSTTTFAETAFLPQAGVLQQQPIQPQPQLLPPYAYAATQPQHQYSRGLSVPTTMHHQQPLPSFPPSSSSAAIPSAPTLPSASTPQGAPQDQQHRHHHHHQRRQQAPHSTPQKRGRRRHENLHRAIAIASGNVSSNGTLAFHTIVAPAPNNKYQSKSFSRRERKKVAQAY